jgi:uncharacterized protein
VGAWLAGLRAGVVSSLLVAEMAGAAPHDVPPRTSTHSSPIESQSVPLPGPLGYVSDHAGVINPTWRERIRSVCQDLERKTGVEMVVVTVPSIKPFGTARDYGAALYEQWGIGTAQQDHGVLVLAVVETREATITLGKSLLPVVTPLTLEEANRAYLRPAFRQGRFAEGLYRAVVVLATALQHVQVAEPSRHKLKGLGMVLTAITGLGALWVLWWISRPDLRHPYGRLRRREFWGSGQGGFGGHFGGFGGAMSGEGWQ